MEPECYKALVTNIVHGAALKDHHKDAGFITWSCQNVGFHLAPPNSRFIEKDNFA